MAVEIFFCYAHEDEEHGKRLEKHLKALKRQGIIDMWHDRMISAGADWNREIDRHLNTAKIILLLVSPDFMSSDYCYSQEMLRAMERHEQGDARVIPVIVRPVYWQGAPFGKLQALPTDANAIISRDWPHLDEAFFDVAEGIRKAALEVSDILTLQQVRDAWESVIKRTKQKTSPAMLSMLRPCKIIGIERRTGQIVVVVQFDKEGHYNYLKANERYKLLEWALTTEFGQQCKVRLVRPQSSSTDLLVEI